MERFMGSPLLRQHLRPTGHNAPGISRDLDGHVTHGANLPRDPREGSREMRPPLSRSAPPVEPVAHLRRLAVRECQEALRRSRGGANSLPFDRVARGCAYEGDTRCAQGSDPQPAFGLGRDQMDLDHRNGAVDGGIRRGDDPGVPGGARDRKSTILLTDPLAMIVPRWDGGRSPRFEITGQGLPARWKSERVIHH